MEYAKRAYEFAINLPTTLQKHADWLDGIDAPDAAERMARARAYAANGGDVSVQPYVPSWLDTILSALNYLIMRIVPVLFWSTVWLVKFAFYYIVIPSAILFVLLNIWYAFYDNGARWKKQLKGSRPIADIQAFPQTLLRGFWRSYYHLRYADSTYQHFDGHRSQTHHYNLWDWMLQQENVAVSYARDIGKWTFVTVLLLAFLIGPSTSKSNLTPLPKETQFVTMGEAATLGYDVPTWAVLATHSRYQGGRTHFPQRIPASQYENIATYPAVPVQQRGSNDGSVEMERLQDTFTEYVTVTAPPIETTVYHTVTETR